MSEAPSQKRIAFAIELVHKARREFWPPAGVFNDADIDPLTKLAWMGQWHKAREGWRDHCEMVVEQGARGVRRRARRDGACDPRRPPGIGQGVPRRNGEAARRRRRRLEPAQEAPGRP